jgi:hypothetical protein
MKQEPVTYRKEESYVDSDETKAGTFLIQAIDSSAAENEAVAGQESKQHCVYDGHVE